jgi:hypothetical protein
MNRVHFLAPSLLTALLLAAAPAFVVPASAQSRCDAPRNHVDRRACEAVREGPAALRHFIWRTQGIYRLYFFDYMTDDDIDRYHAREDAKPSAERRRQVAEGPAAH